MTVAAAGLISHIAVGALVGGPVGNVPTDLRPQPECDPVDTSTFAAYQKSMACRLEFVIPDPNYVRAAVHRELVNALGRRDVRQP